MKIDLEFINGAILLILVVGFVLAYGYIMIVPVQTNHAYVNAYYCCPGASACSDVYYQRSNDTCVNTLGHRTYYKPEHALVKDTNDLNITEDEV